MLRNELTRNILPAANRGFKVQQSRVFQSALVEVQGRWKTQLKQFVCALVELGCLFVFEWNGAQPALVAPVAKQHGAHA